MFTLRLGSRLFRLERGKTRASTVSWVTEELSGLSCDWSVEPVRGCDWRRKRLEEAAGKSGHRRHSITMCRDVSCSEFHHPLVSGPVSKWPWQRLDSRRMDHAPVPWSEGKRERILKICQFYALCLVSNIHFHRIYCSLLECVKV